MGKTTLLFLLCSPYSPLCEWHLPLNSALQWQNLHKIFGIHSRRRKRGSGCGTLQDCSLCVALDHACPQPVSGGIVYIKYCVCKIHHLVLSTTTTTDGRQYLLNILCMSTETDRLSTGMVHIGKSGLPRVHLDLLLQVLTKAIRSILQCDSDC